MNIILSGFFVIGSYIFQPQWFNNGPYEFVQEHKSLAECQVASHGTEDICAGGKQYTLAFERETSNNSAPLDFVECDYWAGCYIQEEN